MSLFDDMSAAKSAEDELEIAQRRADAQASSSMMAALGHLEAMGREASQALQKLGAKTREVDANPREALFVRNHDHHGIPHWSLFGTKWDKFSIFGVSGDISGPAGHGSRDDIVLGVDGIWYIGNFSYIKQPLRDAIYEGAQQNSFREESLHYYTDKYHRPQHGLCSFGVSHKQGPKKRPICIHRVCAVSVGREDKCRLIFDLVKNEWQLIEEWGICYGAVPLRQAFVNVASHGRWFV